MKKHSFSKALFAWVAAIALLCIAAPANGGAPPVRVTVFDANETVVFKGTLGADATFATQNLPPGKYVVHFTSKSASLKGNQYFLAISAGRKKVLADAVAGELLIDKGAAMRVEVVRELRITGQVVREDTRIVSGVSKYRVIDGRPYIWVANEVGTHVQGRWVDATVAPVLNITSYRAEDFRKAQDHAGEGSMLGRNYNPGPPTTGY
jgi:hypothetical protein